MEAIDTTLKAYCGYSREAGSSECAVLIFANTAREARAIGFTAMRDMITDEFTDFAVYLMKNVPHLYAEAPATVLIENTAYVVDNPKSCHRCNQWGQPIGSDHLCGDCRFERDEYAKEQIELSRILV